RAAMRGNSHVRFGEKSRGNDPKRTPRRAAYSTPTLFTQLKALPWPRIPIGGRRRDRGHGRRETRTVKAITVYTPDGIRFPHAEQSVRITRTRTTSNGKTGRETAYFTVSPPADQAQPADLQDWARREGHIDLVHHVRDVRRQVQTTAANCAARHAR
ncbi:hypothetical protein AB0I41_15585, partial [Micromonospora sp. NPDC050200]